MKKNFTNCDHRLYYMVTACIFGLVAVLHYVRIANGWTVILGPWTIPLWFSWLGLALAISLLIWAWCLASK